LEQHGHDHSISTAGAANAVDLALPATNRLRAVS
jgi:hypothetical protein